MVRYKIVVSLVDYSADNEGVVLEVNDWPVELVQCPLTEGEGRLYFMELCSDAAAMLAKREWLRSTHVGH